MKQKVFVRTAEITILLYKVCHLNKKKTLGWVQYVSISLDYTVCHCLLIYAAAVIV